MKKAVLYIIFSLSVVSGVSALDSHLGFHVIPGFSWHAARYSESAESTFHLTNLSVDVGLDFRLSIDGPYAAEAAAGVRGFFLLEKDLESVHSDLTPGGLFYRPGDSFNIYALLDLTVPFPSPRIRLAGGIRYNYTQNFFMYYLTGGLFIRAGFELEIIKRQMLKIMLEINPFHFESFTAETGETLSALFVLNIQASYGGVFFKKP